MLASRRPSFGALVISLDFELHWGVRDHKTPDGPYRDSLLGAREVIPRMLELFAESGVSATWATVGFLLARSRAELQRFSPVLRPSYRDPRLNPYSEPLGEDEADDPLHFAPGLVDRIMATPGQELATHTWSHYYCLEPGQTREEFEADLQAVAALAAERGFHLRSIVFPRNQHNPAYAGVLREAGITCYRGCQSGRIYAAVDEAGNRRWIRLSRLADAYVNIARPCTTRWDQVLGADGLCNVPASRFLRPYTPRLAALESLRLRRITSDLRRAAGTGEIFHL